MEYEKIINLLLPIAITFVSYSTYPFLKYSIICVNKEFSEKQIKKTLLFNSIIVAIIYLIVSIWLYGENASVSFLPAVFYYFINVQLFKHPPKIHLNKFWLKFKNIFKKINLKKKNILILILLIIITLFFVSTCLILNYNSDKEKKFTACIEQNKRNLQSKLNIYCDNSGTTKEQIINGTYNSCIINYDILENIYDTYNESIERCIEMYK